MQARTKVIVALNENEKDFLLLIYKKRRRFLATVYIGLLVVVIFISPVGTDYRRLEQQKIELKNEVPFGFWFGLLMKNIVFPGSIITISFIFFYLKAVLPYKRDANSGVKEKIAYTITSKEYFPLTNQYYVTFDDPNYLHHETDQDTWDRSYEGGYFYIYRTIKSKFVFEDNERYTLI